MKLPVNETPSLTSYVQHAYPCAIIQSRELLILHVSKMDTYQWKTVPNEIEYRIRDEYLYLNENNDVRKDTDFFIQRECQNKDEIMFKTEYMKRMDHMAYLESYLTIENSEGLAEKEKLYSIKWNQFNVNINDILYEYDMNQYIYFKINRIDTKIYAYISVNGLQWEAIGKSIDLDLEDSEKCYIGIHVYIGKNQFLT